MSERRNHTSKIRVYTLRICASFSKQALSCRTFYLATVKYTLWWQTLHLMLVIPLPQLALAFKQNECNPEHNMTSDPTDLEITRKLLVLLCPHYSATCIPSFFTSIIEWLSAKVNRFNKNKLTMNNGFNVINGVINHDLIWICICRARRYQF
jgi:hypothetical protein